MRNSGRIGSRSFCTELNEDAAVVVFSVLAVSLYDEPRLLRNGATAVDWELWKELCLVEVVVLLTWSLLAGLSTMSASREVGGDAALPVAVEAAGGSSCFRDRSWVS